MKLSFCSHANETHLHKKDFALSLVLKVRVFGTQKWAICLLYPLYTWELKRNSFLAWENSRHFATLPLVSREMTSDVHTDDASLPTSRYCFWSVQSNFLRGKTNQKHYPDLGSDREPVNPKTAHALCLLDVLYTGTPTQATWWKQDTLTSASPS